MKTEEYVNKLIRDKIEEQKGNKSTTFNYKVEGNKNIQNKSIFAYGVHKETLKEL